jgi:hypothetical protein
VGISQGIDRDHDHRPSVGEASPRQSDLLEDRADLGADLRVDHHYEVPGLRVQRRRPPPSRFQDGLELFVAGGFEDEPVDATPPVDRFRVRFPIMPTFGVGPIA